MADPAFGGQNGKLILGGVNVTGPEGATFKRGVKSASYGGYGQSHKRNAAVMFDAPTIEVADLAWDPTATTVLDIATTMLSGGRVFGYWYPDAVNYSTKYTYGYWILDDADMDAPVDDIVRNPFTLVAAGNIITTGF
ncbi:MAG: hypothetical protein RL139_1516 [Gemmatimonadota bacterium]|jgi:hypothetical protein